MDKTDMYGVHGLSVSEFRLLEFKSKVKHVFENLPTQFKSKDVQCTKYMTAKILRYLKDHRLVTMTKGRDAKGRFTGVSYLKQATASLPTGEIILAEEALPFSSVHSDLSSVHSLNALSTDQVVDVQSSCDKPGIFGGEGLGEGAKPLSYEEESAIWEQEEEAERIEEARKYREKIEAGLHKMYLESLAKPKEYERPNRMEFEKTIDRMRKEDGVTSTYNIPRERASWKRLVANYGDKTAVGLLYTLRTIRLMDEWWFKNIDLVPSSLSPRVIELLDQRMERMYGTSYKKTERIKP